MIQPLNILCFGDSLTAGYSQYGMRFTPYSQWLKAKLDVELEGVYEVNAATDGVSGELVTRGFRTRMERQCKVAESPPSPVKSRAGRFWGRKVSSFVEKMEKRGVAVSSRKETEMGSGAAVDKKAEMKIDNSKNAAEDPYDWVIFLGGTNDLGWGKKPLEIWAEIKSVTQIPLDAGAKVLLMTVPECAVISESLDAKRDALNRLIMEDSRDWVFKLDLHAKMPSHSLSPEERHEIWDDGLHFTPAGYEKIGNMVADALLKIMDPSYPPSKEDIIVMKDGE